MRIRHLIMAVLVAGLVLGSTAVPAPAQEEPTRLLRFPDVHGDQVVFTYAGDLWIASTDGGTARRLTAHPGMELFAKFSPDGDRIAFTGQYDGDEQVYVVPTRGGVPEQLTWYPARGPLPPRWGYDNQVYDWTPDGSAVLFRSLRDGWDLADSRLYTVSVDGGMPEVLPMPDSGAGDFSPDGGQVVYSPLFRDFRHWKRYAGGWAQDLWIFDLASNEARQITEHPRTDRDPMWIGDRIWFVSDRDGKLNLYAYDPATDSMEQVTDEAEWDVRWPSDDGEDRIVYELGGQLHLLDTGTRESTPISIFVPDDGLYMRPSHMEVAEDIEGFSLSPKGTRALFVARGDVFSVPAEKGKTINLTRTSGDHDRFARWSHDGRWIAWVSDADGDDEIWLVDKDGDEEPRQLTDLGVGKIYAPNWSPDDERIAVSDHDGRLYVVTVEDGAVTEVVRNPSGNLQDHTWAPDGRHLAFTLTEPSGFGSIHVYDADAGELHKVTTEYANEFSPAWGSEGDYLYYLSDRELAPQIGSFEWNYLVDRETYIYAMPLRADVPHPFPPESDEVEVAEEKGDGNGQADDEKKGDGGEENGEQSGDEGLSIDWDGLADRVVRVPVDADNYGGLGAVKGHLIYFRGAPFYYGRSPDSQPDIRIFSLDDRKETVLVEGVQGVAGSPDGSKILVRQGGQFMLYDASPAGKGSGKPVSTAGLEVDRVPVKEWRNIFDEVWRRYRDFFYVENMHGYDWQALRDQYEPLLDHVAHRSDLNYVISEMIAELSASHTYVVGGDIDRPERPSVALPGATFELDADADRYRIAHIYQGDNAEDRYRSPLTEPGVDVSEGDYVLAVDGEPLKGNDNPYRALRNKADAPVELTVNAEPTMEGARTVSFQPLTSEIPLRYYEWVAGNRKAVAEMTDGRVGYLHIPDMGSDGIREFIRWFYPQIRKEALVVDVRGNGGGNVSQMLIERLRRELLATGFSRTSTMTGTYPSTVFIGPMVCLINSTSASDGDIFPAMFREAGLGPLIGVRTWGGVIGITGHGPLIDGGTIYVPEFGNANAEGEWDIEGYGVDPDIEVHNDPTAVLEGRDPQLERGIEELMEIIRDNPVKLPEKPPAPDKAPEGEEG